MSILEIRDLHYEADNTKILKGISMKIEEGDCVSIIGSSGSGKSTLLKICADLIPISKGELIYREKNYKRYNPIELRRKISYCVQLPHLFGDKVYENLEFPYNIRKEKIDKGRIVKLLEKFNLDESFLEKDIKSLSGGEKQRISIIRNLIYKPDILLLDEATSALDKENAMVIEKYIEELNKEGVTVIWITHSLEQSERIFNKRIEISEGQVKSIERI
ncbi:putative ABC transport system ATP-binding protein [Clostridium collagenovorans DSM 3089]|uniref:Putative ABC transport system ATP-binding protein n=1 Tax=Clostridium collagenovorans DSM 3089 TaxID=1121306 RepID=A0A1M5U999_9CLOT|nr:ATP-binding cassette domain-containing protein [Clostridium collagenovorans]SHH59436.1 putative ABC transport system ATP-binding protein [Clostridium collagenovorans DSM 3089]